MPLVYLKCVVCNNKPKVAHQTRHCETSETLFFFCCRFLYLLLSCVADWLVCVIFFFPFRNFAIACFFFVLVLTVWWLVVLLWPMRILLQCANGLMVVVVLVTIAFTSQFICVCPPRLGAGLENCCRNRCHWYCHCLGLPAFRLFTSLLCTSPHGRLRISTIVVTLYKNNYYSYY